MNAPIRRSPLARLQPGAHLEMEAGWELTAGFGDDAAEQSMIRDGIGLADITPRGKVDLHGGLGASFEAPGDTVLARISRHWSLALTAPGAEEDLLPALDGSLGGGIMVTDATHLYAGIALAGRGSAEVLARVTSWDAATLDPDRATGAPLAGVPAVLVRRSLAVPVLEAYVHTELARFVWESMLDVVRGLGGGLVGWRALRREGWR